MIGTGSFRIILVLLFFVSFEMKAANLELNGFYFTDSFSSTSTLASTYMTADGAVNLNLNKKGTLTIGWAYTMINDVATASSTATFTTADMGPRFGWFLNKEKTWGLGLAYNIISNATYDGSGTAVKWRGTSLKTDFGYAPEISENMYCGFRINYYSGSWIEQLVGSSTYSTVSYTRTWMYPSLYFRWEI